jgi:anti-anti-sigma factor
MEASMTALTELPSFSDARPAGTERADWRLTSTGGTDASPPPTLLLTERRLRSCAVLSVRGEIDIATVEHLERAGTRMLSSSGGRLVLDLSETAFMDLSGVRTAERLSRLASDTGGSVVLVAAKPGVRRILALAAHPWLVVTGDLDAALETVSDRASTSS